MHHCRSSDEDGFGRGRALSGGAVTHVTFTVKFYLVPAVVITVQNALATDQIQVLNKTREGFDLNITNAGVAR